MPVVTATITYGEVRPAPAIPATYRLLSIDVRSEVNRIPSAEIRLIDGNVLNEYKVTDGECFTLGNTITIELRYEGKEEGGTLFEGIVVRQTLGWAAEGAILVVTLKDIAVKLTTTRQSAVYHDMTDLQIINELLENPDGAALNGALLNGSTPSVKHSSMVQYDCTLWDFICLRAEALGMLVTVDAGQVSLTPMKTKGIGKSLLKFTWGTNMYEFEVEAAAEHPYGEVNSLAWDPTANALTDTKKATAMTAPEGKIDPAMVAMKVNRQMCQLKHPVPAEVGELQAWANARLSRSSLATVRGRISIPGNAKLELLNAIDIEGISKQFSGTVLVTALHHRYDRSGWRTNVQFGLSPERLCQRAEIAEVPAAGLLPPVRGLQIGVVAAFEEDPKKQLRVKVILPGIDDKPAGAVWARLATMDAGAHHGTIFRPEVDDEVVIGFLFNDPRHPVILGAMFGSKNKGPNDFGSPEAMNEKKGIITKKGTTLQFDDGQNPSLRIATTHFDPQLTDIRINSIVIRDNNGITLKDQYGNSIVMSREGITIDAGSGTVSIKGGMVNVDKSMGMPNQAGQP
ncbi:MAG TPA: type VI secretion system tip protein VgrG [Polyangium sp.]|nr:type VI secretion system tip protein VgrG [Polyangium sp.]